MRPSCSRTATRATVKGEVANLQGLLGQGLNTDRSGGFTDVMAKYPDVKVVAQEPTGWDPSKAVSITENWMTAYPNLDLDLRQQRQPDGPGRQGHRPHRQAGPGHAGLGRRHPVGASTRCKTGTMKSTVLLAPQYSGFWKAYFPFLIATKKNQGTDVLIQGVLVTKDNVAAALRSSRRTR